MKKVFTILVVLVAVVIAVTVLKRSGNQSAEIKVGAILPLSGEGAKYGESARRGMELAVDQINMAGGINGQKLRLKYEIGRAHV